MQLADTRDGAEPLDIADFEIRTATLRYLLGEITLFRKRLKLHHSTGHFLATDPTDSPFAIPSLNLSEADGVMLPSFPLAGRLPAVVRKGGFIAYTPRQYERAFIAECQSFEQYLEKFTAKSRSTLRRKVRKFTREFGEGSFRAFSGREAMAEFHAHAVEVSRKTYQDRLFDAGIPADDEFRDSMLEAADQGICRGYLLFDDGHKPVSYLYTPIVDGNVHLYELVGYDPDYSKFSPGTVLQFHVLEYLFELGQPFVFDFTEGEGSHKAYFANDSRLCGDIYLFRTTPRALLLVYSHLFLARSVALLTAILDRLKVKKTIKKLIRRSA